MVWVPVDPGTVETSDHKVCEHSGHNAFTRGWRLLYLLFSPFGRRVCHCQLLLRGCVGVGDERGHHSSGPTHICRFRATLKETHTFTMRTHLNTPRIGWYQSMWLRVITVVQECRMFPLL